MDNDLQEISSEICNIFANKLTSLTEKQAEHLNLLNNSMNFYIQLKDNDKAIYNARETLKYLKQITKDG
jgi:predicted transglutaminase-like cysteine proteinase